MRVNRRCCQCIWRIVYVVAATGSLASLACFVVFFVRIYDTKTPVVTSNASNHRNDGLLEMPSQVKVIGCSKIEVEDVWVVGIPKLMTESAFRLLDVNGDGVHDILFGFATGINSFSNVYN